VCDPVTSTRGWLVIENRRLRVAELKQLFTFPDDFELVGSRNSIQAQLARQLRAPTPRQDVITALTEED
jgi:DNA (cytosine-5)-methyltransferase 1